MIDANALYPNSNHSDAPAAAAPAAVSPAAATPQSHEEMAKAVYDADRRPAHKDIFEEAARERREAQQAEEHRESDGSRSELKAAVKEALGEQPKTDAQTKPGEQQAKTPEVIQADAAKLVADLNLDASDPSAMPFATTVAELGIGKDGAAKLVELNQQHAQKYWERQSETWAQASIKEFSRDQLADAKLVYRTFGDAEAQAIFDGAYGNHPAILRLLSKAGAALRASGVTR